MYFMLVYKLNLHKSFKYAITETFLNLLSMFGQKLDNVRT